MNMIDVVLVNENDEVTGYMEKLEAHRKGLLHRAISVFIFNSKGEWLLQQRACGKYHCPGAWSNTCCTHPFAGESYIHAAERRLMEEMGLEVTLDARFRFIYTADVGKGLTEHELDMVLTGLTDLSPVINEQEVCAYRYVSESDLEAEVRNNPEHFSPWFLKIYPNIKHLTGEKPDEITDTILRF